MNEDFERATAQNATWTVEFPTMMNGSVTQYTGFYASKGYGGSGFFTVYHYTQDPVKGFEIGFDFDASKTLRNLAARAVNKYWRAVLKESEAALKRNPPVAVEEVRK